MIERRFAEETGAAPATRPRESSRCRAPHRFRMSVRSTRARQVFHDWRGLSMVFGVHRGASMLPTGRLFVCARCRVQVFICRRCDRGQRYCQDCAQEARRASVREAGRRYQHSRHGRFAHAARTRRWRALHKNVTHQGSLAAPTDAVLQPDPPTDAAVAVQADDRATAAPATPRCHGCGCPLPPFVRTGFVRRRGPCHVYRGDLDDHRSRTRGADPAPVSR